MQTKSYYIIYGDKSSEEFNLNIESRVAKPTAIKEYEEIKIPKGKTLYRDKGYGNITITVPFAFVSEPNKWEEDFRNVKTWLNRRDGRTLRFSDDLGIYYKVRKVEIGNEYRSKKRIGKFEVNFICEPYTYIYSGLQEQHLRAGEVEEIYNDYLETRPIYKIYAEKFNGQLLLLKVNGKPVNITVLDGLITIDTDRGIISTKYGAMAYEYFEGNFEDLYLKEGMNTIEYFQYVATNSVKLNYDTIRVNMGTPIKLEPASNPNTNAAPGIHIELIPNWRTI